MFALILGTHLMLLSNPPKPTIVWGSAGERFSTLAECEAAGRIQASMGFAFRCDAA